jgi:uncharacterized membrane protein YgdD (TMEM256/DUF423 family)
VSVLPANAVSRFAISVGSVLAGLAVAAGAFGAHSLGPFLEAAGQVGNWETAARYAMVHGLATVVAGLVAGMAGAPPRLVAAAAWCFALGTLVFSGCLAALALSGVRMLGAVVPIGGTLLIVGWTLLAVTGWRMAGSRSR